MKPKIKKISNVKLISGAILILVLTLSIGFSAFGNELYINDLSLRVITKADIRLSGMRTISVFNGASSSYDDYSFDEVTSGITLPNKNSSITYEISITNFGNTEMGIYDILNLPDNLTYTLDDYKIGDMLCNKNNDCSLGIVKTFYLTIGYKDGMYDGTDIDYNLNLKFEFRKMHRITYENVAGTDYPTSIIDGGSIKIDFSNEPAGIIYIYLNDELLENHNHDDPIFEMNTVNGEISIIKADVDFGINSGNTEFVSDQISESSNTSVADFMAMDFEGQNLTKKTITKIDVIVTFKSNTGAKQSVDVILDYGDKQLSQQLEFTNKTNEAIITFPDPKKPEEVVNIGENTKFLVHTVQNKISNGQIIITSMKIVVTFDS